MDTRLDFQRLLEDMDKVIQAKQQELDELDGRLEVARTQLSDLEANELLREAVKVQEDGKQPAATTPATTTTGQHHNLIHQQRQIYEEQLRKFNDELAELESINQELVAENKSLTARLNKSLRNNEDLQVKTSSLADKLEEALNANLDLNLSLGRAQSEIKSQERLLRKTHDEDEILLKAIGDKLESVERTLEERDEEIKRLRLDNEVALQSFAMIIGNNEDKNMSHHQLANRFILNDRDEAQASLDTITKEQVIKLVNESQEKNSQVKQLKLLHATSDLEKKAASFESSNQEKTIHISDRTAALNNQTTGQKIIDRSDVNDLLKRYEMLESDLESKCRQLHLSEFKNNHYETILPQVIAELLESLLANLKESSDSNTTLSTEKIKSVLSGLEEIQNRLGSTRELLRKIDGLERVNYEKDARIKELVKELNELYETGPTEVFNCLEESIKADAKEKLEIVPVESSSKTEASSDGSMIDDNLPCCQCSQNKSQVQDTGSANNLSESDTQPAKQLRHQQKIENQLCASDKSSPKLICQDNEGKKPIAQQSSEETQAQANENKLDRQKSKCTMTSDFLKPELSNDSDIALSLAQDRLKVLENENELLELAMKEILLSLKWSDAQCNSLLIDCPSLERLCQLTEAKFLTHLQDESGVESSPSSNRRSKILFQLVILKSELDILRGQNEELRSNSKAQFRECINRLTNLNSEHAISTIAQQVGLKVSQACQTDFSLEPIVEIKCKNCSKLTNLAKHLLQCIMRVETRLRVSDEIYTSQLLRLHQVIQKLEKDLSNSECELDETRRELIHQNQRKLSTDIRMQYIQDQLSFHMKFCSMSQISTSLPRLGSENLQIYTTAKSGNGDSIESYTISQKTGNRSVSNNDAKMKDPRMTISMLQSIISCLQSRIDFKDARLKQLEDLLTNVTKNEIDNASNGFQ